uniref:Uncharacterized protein LOC111133223 isoform X2 n=1 Tax=Crassostrea virginica TaxID=6565 RepID=A0A8B8EC01_CRAVI|nr:uncharacterized protein LOC111133223 isoform X2 [Crassostrea virginica]
MQGVLWLMFLGTLLSSFLLFYECRKLDGYKFPVYTTEFCPRNKTEWEARSSEFNCNEDSSYACLPNENITELLQFCYPLQIISIEKGVCLYLTKKKSEPKHIDCNHFRYGCPSSAYWGSTIYNYPSCVSVGNGCFLAEPFCKSTTQHTGQKGQQGSHGNDMILIPSLIGALVLCAIVFLSIFFYRRKKRNSKLQTIDEENPETLKLLSEKENAERNSKPKSNDEENPETLQLLSEKDYADDLHEQAPVAIRRILPVKKLLMARITDIVAK